MITLLQDEDCSGFAIREASSPGGPMLDQVDLWTREDGMRRLAAIDPAIAFSAWDALPGAHQVSGILAGREGLFPVIQEANSRMYSALGRAEGGVRYAASLCDWSPREMRMSAAQAGDCNVWTRDADTGEWSACFPDDPLTATAREEWNKVQPPQTMRLRHLTAHDDVLGTREVWECTVLGEFVEGKYRFAEKDNVDAVAVVTDGIVCSESFYAAPSIWMSDMHSRGEDWPHEEPHGDIAVLVAWCNGSRPILLG